MTRALRISLALVALVASVALYPSAQALARGEVYYIAMGETCAWGWENRSGNAGLTEAYAPTPEYEHLDMCIGGL